MSVILIGYRGSGKTTLGRQLAEAIGWLFVDLDERIIKTARQSIREIFSSRGEAGFRQLETRALQKAVKLQNHVLSLGGGAVLSAQNRKIIKSSKHTVAYLHAKPEVLHQRILTDPATAAQRPGLTHLGGSVEEVRTLLAQRLPLYRELADIELDVNSASTQTLVDQLRTMLPNL